MTTDPFATPGQQVPNAGRDAGDAEDRAPVPRDQWDRYLIPQIDGSKPAANKGFTRVSTIKAAILNKRGIERWKNRVVARGLSQRPDLMKALAVAVRDDDEKAIGAVVAQAYTAGGGKDRSGLGTVVHDATERINRGEQDVMVPEEYRVDVDAYYQLLTENSVRVLPEFMERVVLCPYNSAGTFDNLVEWFDKDGGDLDDEGNPTGEWQLLIADLKTGRNLEPGWLEILIQLWLYANAYGVLDIETMTYTPLPREVRKDRAMIIHVPMAGGVAELFVLDISGVEQYVQAAVTARRGNNEAKLKVRSIGKVEPAPFVLAPTLTGADPSSGAPLTNVMDYAAPAGTVPDPPQPSGWKPEVAPPPQTPQQVADAETFAQRMAQVQRTGDYAGELAIPPTGMSQGGHEAGTTLVDSREVGTVVTPAVLNGEGKPLAPLAGPGKKGCSVCRRTGHRKGSKICLGILDPAATSKEAAAGRVSEEVPAEEAAQLEPPTDDGGKEATARAELAEEQRTGSGPDPFAVPASTAIGTPYCDVAQHRSQGWTAGPDGTAWVCPVDGRPSRESYERTQADPIAAEIEACVDPADVLAVRARVIGTSKWTSTYDEQARLKHQSLSWPTP